MPTAMDMAASSPNPSVIDRALLHGVRLRFAIAAGVALACIPVPDIASGAETFDTEPGLDLDNSIRIGAFRTDNLLRLPGDLGIEETVGTVDVSLNLAHESRVTRAVLAGRAGFRHYYEDTFEDEVLGDLFAGFNFDLFSDALTWTIDDHFGTLQRNPYLADTPGNRENVNNFSTGPDLIMIMGSGFALELGARYRFNNFEVSEIDNEVVSAYVALARALSSTRTLSLNFEGDRIEYVDFVEPTEYDRYTAYAQVASETSRGSLIVDLGMNEIRYRGNGENESGDGFFANVEFNHELSSRTKLSLAYNQRFSQAGDIFQGFRDPGEDLNFPSYGPNSTGDPFDGKRADLALRHDRGGVDWYAAIGADDLDYLDNDALDRRGADVRLGFGWSLVSGWRFQASGRFHRGSFTTAERDDDDVFANAAVSRNITRHFDIELGYFFAQRKSSDVLADYRENRVVLTIGYTGDRD